VVIPLIWNQQALTQPSVEDIYVAIMGVTGSGKSQFIQRCSKSKSVKIGHNLWSCTQDVQEHSFLYRDKRIHLIDTPGFDDTTRTDREVLDEVARWFGTAYQDNIQLTGILYLQRITDVKMAGTAFNNLRMFKKLCGESFYPRVTLATTFWDTVPEADGKRREAELMSTDEFWGCMIERGSSVYRHTGTEESAMALLQSIIKHRMDASRTSAPTYVRMQREIAEENKSLDETSAGREVNAKILEERRKFERQLREAKEDFQIAMQENDRRAAESIQKHKELLEQKIRKGYEDQEKLSVRLEDMQTKHMEELAKMAQVIEEQKSMIESIKKVKEEKEERLRQMNSRSAGAVALRTEIDEQSDILHQAEESLEEQTVVLEEKKKSMMPRQSRFAVLMLPQVFHAEYTTGPAVTPSSPRK
jgi:myosin heavy subunit